jgi:hypothetical protein
MYKKIRTFEDGTSREQTLNLEYEKFSIWIEKYNDLDESYYRVQVLCTDNSIFTQEDIKPATHRMKNLQEAFDFFVKLLFIYNNKLKDN